MTERTDDKHGESLAWNQERMTPEQVKDSIKTWGHRIPADGDWKKDSFACGIGVYDTRREIMSHWISIDTEGRA